MCIKLIEAEKVLGALIRSLRPAKLDLQLPKNLQPKLLQHKPLQPKHLQP